MIDFNTFSKSNVNYFAIRDDKFWYAVLTKHIILNVRYISMLNSFISYFLIKSIIFLSCLDFDFIPSSISYLLLYQDKIFLHKYFQILFYYFLFMH